MKYLLIAMSIIFVITTSGCATSKGEGTPMKALESGAIDTNKTVKALTPDELKAIRDDLNELIAYCQPVLSGMETDAKSKSKWAFGLSMAGLISGSVIAPALTAANASANAAWIAATSGFAGATNTASEALRSSGLSGTSDAQTRKEIVDNLRTKLAIIVNPDKTVSEVQLSIIAARAECVLYNIAIPSISATPN